MRLEPELIPEPLWGISASRLLGRKSKSWREIRASALASAGDACAACDQESPGGRGMVCDELWKYDDQEQVAELSGVRILCPACDHARHFARAGQLGLAAEALRTLALVNGITEHRALALQQKAMRDWARRSSRSWTVRVARPFADRYPALAVLDGRTGAPGQGREKVSVIDGQAPRTTEGCRASS
jgi:hypothetical protein